MTDKPSLCACVREDVVGDVMVTRQGVRWTYRGSRSQGWVDVAFQPPGEEETFHTVTRMVWNSVLEGSTPLAATEGGEDGRHS